MLTRRDFVWSAAALVLRPDLLANDQDSLTPAKIRVNGPDSLRVHAAAVGLHIGCAVVPSLLDLDADPASGSQLGSQDPYT
jgi:hypothetical protein